MAQRFEAQRGHLRAVAYRMLGSVAEADDVIQDAWLRVAGSDASQVENLRGWLTTIVARLCLDALRVRKSRREDHGGLELPDPIVAPADLASDPEQQALLADSVGLAMIVVLDSLAPAERLAFVLHDVFAMPFEEIAPIVDRSTGATRQLASRARRRVRGSPAGTPVDLKRQRVVVDAFLAAAREGDFDRLVALLDPDVVARADFGTLRPELNRETRGAREVATLAASFSRLAPNARPALVNGSPGFAVFTPAGPYAVLAFAIRGDRITEIDIVGDPDPLHGLDAAAFEER